MSKIVKKKYKRSRYRKLFPGKETQINDVLKGIGNLAHIKYNDEENIFSALEIYENVYDGNYEYIRERFSDKSECNSILNFCKFQIDHGGK